MSRLIITMLIAMTIFTLGSGIGVAAPTTSVANFSANTTEGYAPLSVQFTDLSENATSVSWDFGDGSNSTEENPVHEFTTAGTFTVNLTATNENGTDSKLATINVVDVAPASTMSNFTNGGGNYNIDVINPGNGKKFQTYLQLGPDTEIKYAGNITNVVFAIPDDSTFVNLSSVTTFKIQFWRYNGTTYTCIGSTDELKSQLVYGMNNITLATPIAVQAGDNYGLAVGNTLTPTVCFDYNASSDYVMYYKGTASVVGNSYNFTSSGKNYGNRVYRIGLQGTKFEKTIPVLPVANFTANKTEGFAPLDVQFNDLSENATSVSWDFGDGSNSAEENPVHEFTTAGNFTVNLTVINGNGTDSKSAIINVTKKPIHWAFSPQEPVSGDILNIDGSASPGEKVNVFATFEKAVSVSGGKFEYNLKDVKIPEGFNNSFTVEANGAKNLNVRVKMVLWVTKSSEASGDTSTVSQSNVPPGTYKIKIDGDAGEGVSEVNLKIRASQGIKADSNGNFSYSYDTTAVPPGNFEVKIGDITKEITLKPKEIEEPSLVLPVANFSTSVTEGYAPLTVQFTDLSENATSVSWDFGDGSNSTERNPVHKFTTQGIYTVNLTASNADGTDAISKTITVTGKPVRGAPKAKFTAVPQAGRAPLTVKFTDKSTNAASIKWDFGDKSAISTESKPSHTYKTAGIYFVKLTAINGNKSNVAAKIVFVTERWRR